MPANRSRCVGGIMLLALFSSQTLLFPNGRFAPRWTRWLAVVQVIYWTVEIFVLSSAPPVVGALSFVLFLMLTGSLGVVQIYRYRRVSSAIERQQTRWVVLWEQRWGWEAT